MSPARSRAHREFSGGLPQDRARFHLQLALGCDTSWLLSTFSVGLALGPTSLCSHRRGEVKDTSPRRNSRLSCHWPDPPASATSTEWPETGGVTLPYLPTTAHHPTTTPKKIKITRKQHQRFAPARAFSTVTSPLSEGWVTLSCIRNVHQCEIP